ncbi:MAG: hypothetical protein GY828_00525 [Candidatus Gracilibacteria bacterium]|nr:hypothetical protein [Candidatus Gracilibacteria bacterium]
MKKILSYLLLFLFLITTHSDTVSANTKEENYFVVTAYYSPLPNQDFYLKGNYHDEIILNGRGIAGASGKKVFSGMLAAPSSYRFGTKISLEGLGIGSVEDRGGAIVPAGNRGYQHDRIDLWVGYGDEGLRRALYWGKRKIKGDITTNNTSSTFDYTQIPAPKWVTKGFKKSEDKIKNNPNNLLPEQLGEYAIFQKKVTTDGEINKLQDILIQLGLYQGELTGNYSDIEKIILQYQLDNDVIENKESLGAGYFGPKTRKSLQGTYAKKIEFDKKVAEVKRNLSEIKTESNIKAEIKIETLGYLNYGDISQEVRELQLLLQQLGYFHEKDTAIFGKKTRDAIVQFQLKEKIIFSKNSKGAGVFGPATKKTLTKIFSNVLYKEQILIKDIDSDIIKLLSVDEL